MGREHMAHHDQDRHTFALSPEFSEDFIQTADEMGRFTVNQSDAVKEAKDRVLKAMRNKRARAKYPQEEQAIKE